MRYEIYTDDEGWRWRFFDDTENVLISAAHSLTQEQCRTAVQLLRLTLDAPVCVAGERRGETSRSLATSSN